jgi:hypothetical protein
MSEILNVARQTAVGFSGYMVPMTIMKKGKVG